LQPLADDDLKNVAGANVLDTLVHRLLELLARKVRFVREGRLRERRNIGWRQFATGRFQPCDQRVDAALRVGVGPLQVVAELVQPGHRHHHFRLVHVVEHDHLIVERERQVGQLPVVRRGVGQILGVAHHVVAGVADRAAGKRRQFGQRGRSNRVHAFFQFRQGVDGREFFAPVVRNHDYPIATRFDLHERIRRQRRQKTVATNLLAADHALEQTGRRAGIDLVKRRDGRQRIGQQSAVDRHPMNARGKFAKRCEIWLMFHRAPK